MGLYAYFFFFLAALHTGIALVTVVAKDGRVIGETTFTYRDHKSEARIEIDRLLDETFSWCSEDVQNSQGDWQDSLGCYQGKTGLV